MASCCGRRLGAVSLRVSLFAHPLLSTRAKSMIFNRIQNSWHLMGSCLHVLSRDKELVIFPILSGIASLIVLGSFAGGMWGTGLLETVMESARQADDQAVGQVVGSAPVTSQEIIAWAVMFAWYFVSYTVVIYFNAALVGAAYIRLHGGDPTVADGLAAANRCLPSILGYAAVAASVGLVLRIIESRSEAVGRFVAGLLGMAWSLVTYLIVPVLVIERAGAFGSIKRSAGLFRKTWGEQIVANIGFGLVGFLLALPGIAGLAAGVILGFGAGSIALGAAFGGASVLCLLGVAVVLSALQGIYTAALYAYATHGEVRGFPVELVTDAFRPRR
jgi:hypothetical protein